MNFEDIGARVKKRRMELNLTQEKLAEKAELTETHIGAIERATSKCSIETLVRLAQVLELNVDYLLFGTTANNIDATFSNLNKIQAPEINSKGFLLFRYEVVWLHLQCLLLFTFFIIIYW